MIAGAGLDIWIPSTEFVLWAGAAVALAVGWWLRGRFA